MNYERASVAETKAEPESQTWYETKITHKKIKYLKQII